jgi:hypothetical protein
MSSKSVTLTAVVPFADDAGETLHPGQFQGEWMPPGEGGNEEATDKYVLMVSGVRHSVTKAVASGVLEAKVNPA